MSDKEAKLAAARKRAEALKAKKAEKKEDAVKADHSEAVDGESTSVVPSEDAKPGKGNTPKADGLEQEIQNLKRLLEENKSQQDVLQERLKSAEQKHKDSEKEMRLRIKELEDSLTRRDEHVRTLEMELSKSTQSNEEISKSTKDHIERTKALEEENNKLKVQGQSNDRDEELERRVKAASSGQAEAEQLSTKLKEEMAALSLRYETLEKELQKANHEEENGATEATKRNAELQRTTETLQNDNQSLIAQLSELRTHLMSVQDEKFAMAESIERLQRDVKEAKEQKSGYRTSFDAARPRASKQFDRSESLQEISLDGQQNREDDPRQAPADLQSNIRIDLTSWYAHGHGEKLLNSGSTFCFWPLSAVNIRLLTDSDEPAFLQVISPYSSSTGATLSGEDGPMSAPTIGQSLKDAYKATDNWTSNGIKWLDDVQEFYRERSAIEKEYGTKLQALAKKYQEKRTKKTASLSVGDSPTMTPGSLENASCTTWARILDNTKLLGDERSAHSDELKMQVAEQIKSMSFKWEEYRKRCEFYNAKLVEEREKTYADLKQVQKRYYDQCSAVEKERMKASHDGKSKHNKVLQANMADMNNFKNTYIVSINSSNAHKRKYYHEDVPDLLDTFQDLNEIRVQKLNSIWQKATQLEQSCLIRQGGHLGASAEAINRNQPGLDTAMFIQHNGGHFNEPPAFGFEACPIWHDTPDIVVDESSKVYLQNALVKSRKTLTDLRTTVQNRRREIDGLKQLKVSIVSDSTRGNIEDVIMNLLRSQIDISTDDTNRNKLETEVATITQVAGDIDRGITEHEFKSASFAIPTNCDYCGSTIWGMSRKGYHCKACSYNCHKNCQMKVPANCTQEKGNTRTANGGQTGEPISRTHTMNSTAESVYGTSKRPVNMDDSDSNTDASSSRSAIPAANPVRTTSTPTRRALAPPPATGYDATASTMTKVLYDYDASSPQEISIVAGDLVTVLEADDGSGWIRVKGARGEGLAPAAYVENPVPQRPSVHSRTDSSESTASRAVGRQGPAVAPKRAAQRKGRQVKALYDYAATGMGELSIHEGDLINLVTPDQGDGWMTGEKDGRSGIFPAAYVETI